jgi:hypothetical protein
MLQVLGKVGMACARSPRCHSRKGKLRFPAFTYPLTLACSDVWLPACALLWGISCTISTVLRALVVAEDEVPPMDRLPSSKSGPGGRCCRVRLFPQSVLSNVSAPRKKDSHSKFTDKTLGCHCFMSQSIKKTKPLPLGQRAS